MNDGDWTLGPAKWAAVAVVGGASIVGLGWSVAGRSPVAAPPAPPTPHAPSIAAPTAPPTASSPPPAHVVAPSRPGHVGAAAAASAEPKPRGDAVPVGGVLDLNSAGADELQLLEGIGPVLAARIIADRRENGPYRSVNDLARVPGIGPRTVEKVRPLVTVR